MGLFDTFKKNKEETSEEVVEKAGWDAITEAFEKVYPNQKNPKHYGTLIKWKFGGNDPLDGISVYDGGNYWHFVTYGLSELYEKETEEKDISGFGMEFTLKLKKGCYEDEESEIRCICGILQAIARITFDSGEIFRANEYVYTGQQTGMDTRQKSLLTGFITVSDTSVSSISTPNGNVNFVEFIGVTDAELVGIQNKVITVEELYKKLGSDYTDYSRDSLL